MYCKLVEAVVQIKYIYLLKKKTKDGQRQGRGFTLTIWEAFTVAKDLEPDKKE